MFPDAEGCQGKGRSLRGRADKASSNAGLGWAQAGHRWGKSQDQRAARLFGGIPCMNIPEDIHFKMRYLLAALGCQELPDKAFPLGHRTPTRSVLSAERRFALLKPSWAR